MKQSLLKDRYIAAGAHLVERFGKEVVSSTDDHRAEYSRIRESVGLTDFSHVQKYRIPQETAIDFLDGLLAGNVAKTRFGRVAHTFMANDDGHIIADCYVANNDEEYLLLCESLLDDNTLEGLLRDAGAEQAGLENLTDTHVVLSLDGFKAWKVVKELFGADVLGLPYLSIEMYPFENTTVRLLRCGKTSEFGYLLMIEQASAGRFFDRLRELAEAQGGGLCGVAIHNDLRLEGRFFNIFAEGARVRDPLVLGLQWMIDFEKESFKGSEAIYTRRARGLSQKIIGIQVGSSVAHFEPGSKLYNESQPVAEVVATTYSYLLESGIGLAVFPFEIAFAGLEFHLGSQSGALVRTVSMPPILPKSLTIKLDEM